MNLLDRPEIRANADGFWVNDKCIDYSEINGVVWDARNSALTVIGRSERWGGVFARKRVSFMYPHWCGASESVYATIARHINPARPVGPSMTLRPGTEPGAVQLIEGLVKRVPAKLKSEGMLRVYVASAVLAVLFLILSGIASHPQTEESIYERARRLGTTASELREVERQVQEDNLEYRP